MRAEDGRAVCYRSQVSLPTYADTGRQETLLCKQVGKRMFSKAIDEFSNGWLTCTHTKKRDEPRV